MIKINSWSRTAALGAVFALTVSAGISVATFGISKEQTAAEVCARSAWPYIPASCLDGISHSSVRVVALDATSTNLMAARFAAAFE